MTLDDVIGIGVLAALIYIIYLKVTQGDKAESPLAKIKEGMNKVVGKGDNSFK